MKHALILALALCALPAAAEVIATAPNKDGGKRVWVKHCHVGNAADGVVFKDYKLQDQP